MRLECRGLTAGYGRMDILFDVRVAMESGKVTCVLGPNGAGKSTLLKAMYGLVNVHDGTVTVDGEDITRARPETVSKRGIAYVPQSNNVFPTLSVLENLDLGRRPGCKTTVQRIVEIFPALGAILKKPAGRLSGGQRTMVAVGRALMSDPGILLIDEPTAGLAPGIATVLWKEIGQLATGGMGVGVVEQNVRLALANSHDAYLLTSGRNREHSEAREMLDRADLEQIFLDAELAAELGGR